LQRLFKFINSSGSPWIHFEEAAEDDMEDLEIEEKVQLASFLTLVTLVFLTVLHHFKNDFLNNPRCSSWLLTFFVGLWSKGVVRTLQLLEMSVECSLSRLKNRLMVEADLILARVCCINSHVTFEC
jgi:hypothetical protein